MYRLAPFTITGIDDTARCAEFGGVLETMEAFSFEALAATYPEGALAYTNQQKDNPYCARGSTQVCAVP